MADNWLQCFAVALGFEVNTASLNTAKKSIADYEKAVVEAEKRIEDARWPGAKTEEEIAKLTRETNLKEARAALASAQEREKFEKETARKREERHKEFVSGLNKAALAATAAATAISYAVNKVTSAFDNLGFVAQRTGASVQSLNSLGYAFKQTGGSAQQAVGAVERFAQALRGNDGLKAFVKGLGVDTSKDMGDQYLDTIAALSKHPYQVGMREAGILGIGEEDYKLVTDHLRQIREYRDEYNRTTKSLGVDSDKAAQASQSFQRTLARLQATTSALSDKLMVSLAPALEAIATKFNDWVSANPDKIEAIMNGIGTVVTWVSDKIQAFVGLMGGENGERFLAIWKSFSDRLAGIAGLIELIIAGVKKLDSALHLSSIYGLIDKAGSAILSAPGAVLQGGDAGAGGKPEDKRKWYEKILPKVMGGKEAPSQVIGDAGRAIRATSRNIDPTVAAYIRQAAAARGINPDTALAVADGEGLGGSTPNRLTPGDFVNGKATSFGPFQIHRGGRGSVGTEYERATGHSADDPTYWQEQIDFSLSWAKKHGWAAWYGRSKHNVGVNEGLNYRPQATAAPTAPRNMTPGSFDPNNIDPKNLMPPAPVPGSTTNNSSVNKPVTQNISMTTTIHGSDSPKESARVMETAFGRMHGLALANAQSAVV